MCARVRRFYPICASFLLFPPIAFAPITVHLEENVQNVSLCSGLSEHTWITLLFLSLWGFESHNR